MRSKDHLRTRDQVSQRRAGQAARPPDRAGGGAGRALGLRGQLDPRPQRGAALVGPHPAAAHRRRPGAPDLQGPDAASRGTSRCARSARSRSRAPTRPWPCSRTSATASCAATRRCGRSGSSGGVTIALDHTPIGDFAEFEGDGAETVAKRCGFDPDKAERRSYLRLYEEYLKQPSRRASRDGVPLGGPRAQRRAMRGQADPRAGARGGAGHAAAAADPPHARSRCCRCAACRSSAIRLAQLAAAGCEAAAVNLHYLGDQIRQRFGDSHAGMPLTWSEEPEVLGHPRRAPPADESSSPRPTSCCSSTATASASGPSAS